MLTSRLDAINHLRANASDPVCVAMFHDMRIDLLDEDPLTSPLFFRFRCTRREWLTHGPLLATLHPITRVELSDFNPINDRGGGFVYVYFDQDNYDAHDMGLTRFIWEEDVPAVWTHNDLRKGSNRGSEEFLRYLVSSAALSWAIREQGRTGEDGAPLPPLYQNPLDPTEGSFTPYADPPVPA